MNKKDEKIDQLAESLVTAHVKIVSLEAELSNLFNEYTRLRRLHLQRLREGNLA